LAPEPVLLLSKAPLGAEASSLWAQGGLAAAMGEDDAPALHLADTLAAGAGLCDEAIASRIVHAAPAAVEHLARLGVAFDRRPDGGWRLGWRRRTAATGSCTPPATAPGARSCVR